MSTITLPNEPVIVAPYNAPNGGVDFLGLRQVNLDMMAGCLPGINNVTDYIRPFSLISWMYWKFYQLSEQAGIDRVTRDELRAFTEKSEILFTWGHVRAGIGGVPGANAAEPRAQDGRVSLRFSDWKRQPGTTSLMAAVQYGPASKSLSGLGFIEPRENGFFRACAKGVDLARALDARISKTGGASVVGSLGAGRATPEDADSLMKAWSIRGVTAAERKAFRSAFYEEGTIGADDSVIGRRSATVRLVLDILAASRDALPEDDVRQRMVMLNGQNTQQLKLTEITRAAWARWATLQVRQVQRLGLEAMLTFVESRIIHSGDTSTFAIVNAASAYIASVQPRKDFRSPLNLRQGLARRIPDTKTFLELPQDDEWGLFQARDRLLHTLDQEQPASQADILRCSLMALFLSARAVELLESDLTASVELRRGGVDRISLWFWKKTLDRLEASDWRDFLTFVIETLILSQHFAVAAGRYDGGTQRLRISIEERGLEPLVAAPLAPLISRDRLRTALSLMLDAGLIAGDRDADRYEPIR